jgi:hypothetical protein
LNGQSRDTDNIEKQNDDWELHGPSKVGVNADACCIGLGCLTFVEVSISEMVHNIKP